LTNQLEAHIQDTSKQTPEDAMTKMERMKDKIRKLRARASDGASSESEAVKAIEIADKLMAEHALTVKDLEKAVDSGGIETGSWTKGTKKLHHVQYLAASISLLTETNGWVATDTDGIESLVFMGFSADVEYALYLSDLCFNAMEAEWDSFRISAPYLDSPSRGRPRLREDFMRGMASRIREKMMNIVALRRTQAPEVSQIGTSLVIAKRSMIASALENSGVNIRKRRASKKRTKTDIDAFLSGRMAGDATNITTGIGNHT
jgi:hypothetical protein